MSHSPKLSQRIQPHEATPWVIEAIRAIETSGELLQGEVRRLTRELAEAKARAVPDGWVAVPVEPDQKMKDAGWSTYLNDDLVKMGNIYRAMLSARPECPPNGLSSKESGR